MQYAVLSAARFERPLNPLYDGRAMAVQVYRQGARPILLANFHGTPQIPIHGLSRGPPSSVS